MTSASIKQKSISGAKWTIVFSVLSLPLNYLLTMFLGRVGPEVLGLYSSVLIFITALPAFIYLSGSAVLSNFIPKIDNRENLSKFIFSYAVLAIAAMIIFMILLYLFPTIFQYLFKRTITTSLLVFFLIFTPVCVLSLLVQHYLLGFLEFKFTSLIERVQLLGLLPIIVVFFIFFKITLAEYYFFIILSAVFILNLLSLIIGIYAYLKKIAAKPMFGFYLPDGFWNFSISIQLTSLLSYGFVNIDKIFVLKLGELYQLGLYQAVISIWMLIDFFPQILYRVLVPMFSSYIALNNNEAVKKAYVLIERYSIFISITVGLFIIIFAKELLSIFGEKYIENYSLLVLLAAGTAFGTLQYVNNTLLISTEKNKELLANATLRIGVQLLLSFFLVDKIGVLGVVIARIVSLLVGQIIPIWIICKLPYDLRIPREFYVGIIITILIAILYYMIDLRSVYIKVLIFFLGFGLFCRYARYCLNDIKFFYSLLIKQNSIPI